MEVGQDGGQPFSMHARGVSAMDSTQYLDCGYQLSSAVKQVRFGSRVSSRMIVFEVGQDLQSPMIGERRQ